MTNTTPPQDQENPLVGYTNGLLNALDRHALLSLAVAISFWISYSLYHWIVDLQSPLAMFYHLSWDEFQYMALVRKYQEALLRDGWIPFFRLSDRFGYGTLFWQVYSILSLPFLGAADNPSSGFLLSLRVITLVLQTGCLGLVWKVVGALGFSGRAQSLAMLILAPMSGLLLMYKPFSPDYLAAFLVLLAGWIALRSPRLVWLAFLLFGAGCATKLTNVLLVPVVFAAVLIYRRDFRTLAMAAPAYLAGFLLANTDVLLSGTMQPYLERLKGLSAQMNDPGYMHAIQPPSRLNYLLSWLNNPMGKFVNINSPGITREFLAYPVLLFSFGVIAAYWRSRAILLTGGTGLVLLAAIILSTNRVWTWYVILPILLVAMGLAMGLDRLSRTRFAIAVGIVAFAHLGFSLKSLVEKSQEFHSSRTTAETIDRNRFYKECVLPNRRLIQTSKPEELVVQFGVPVDPILRQAAICGRYPSVLPCIKERTRTVLLYKPFPTDNASLEQGFEVTSCSALGKLYRQKTVVAKGCQGRFDVGWYNRESGPKDWWHWSSKFGKIVLVSAITEKLTIKGGVSSAPPGNVLEVLLDGKPWKEISLDASLNLTVEMNGSPRELELRSRKAGVSLPPDTRTFAIRASNFVVSGESSGACEVR